jgi:flagella basal body P-ring formation protein FlgA
MNKFKIKYLATAVAMSVCMTATAFAAAMPKAESIITHDQITLGDVFDGITADADHYLAPAPELGKTVTLGTYDLTRISDAFNLGWKPDGDGAHVVIRRGSDEIDNLDIQSALEKKLQQEMKGQKFDTELSDKSVGFHVAGTADRTVTVEKMTYDAVNNTFRAVVAAAAAPGTRKEVSGHYYAVSRIPVLKEPLRPGDIISANDIDYIDMRSNDISSSMVTEAANLVGQTPRRGVAAMKPLTLSDVKLPVIVKKGDLVTMVLKNNALNLTAQGRAMDNGSAGDAIRVMNSTSKQVIDAIVTGTQTVSIKPPLSAL